MHRPTADLYSREREVQADNKESTCVSDIPTILSFIQKAAAETDPSAKIEATEERLRATLHLEGSNDAAGRVAFALVIVPPEGGPAAGHAIYTYQYSAWRAQGGIYLDELYVGAEHRRRGYARLLIGALAGEARGKGCGKLEWNCYRDNERALRFYEGIGARRMDSWVVLRLVGDKFDGMAGEAESGAVINMGKK